MTYQRWMAARFLLFQEHMGLHLRAQETEKLAKEQRTSDLYAKSVHELKRRQLEQLES